MVEVRVIQHRVGLTQAHIIVIVHVINIMLKYKITHVHQVIIQQDKVLW